MCLYVLQSWTHLLISPICVGEHVLYTLYVLYELYVLYTLYVLCVLYTLYELYVLYVLYTLYVLCVLYTLYELYVLYVLYTLYVLCVLYTLYELYVLYVLYTLYVRSTVCTVYLIYVRTMCPVFTVCVVCYSRTWVGVLYVILHYCIYLVLPEAKMHFLCMFQHNNLSNRFLDHVHLFANVHPYCMCNVL